MKKRKRRLVISAVLCGICIGAAVVLGQITGWAVFQETDAVHIRADEIENSTLIIGTHLIYLGSLNDEIYALAQESARESGQDKIYYKSELAQGAWYEISSAYSIADITAEGTPVPDTSIEQLWLTHHTKSDQITYDLRSKEAVNVYDIYPVYDLESMKELEPIKNQYDLYQNGKEDNGNLGKIKAFFAIDVTSKETEDYDLKLEKLSEYLQVLRENKAEADELSVMDKIIGKVDDGRRAVVYRKVDNELTKLLNDVSAGTDTDLVSAVSESQQNVQSSLDEKEGNMLKEGDMIMSREEYDLAQKLITAALKKQHKTCDEQAAKLIALYHVTEGQIAESQAEVKLLDEELIPMAERMLREELGKGENAEYKAAKEKSASHVVLEGIIDTRRQQEDAYRSELQFYIEARTERISSEEAKTYITGRIKDAGIFSQAISKDDFNQSGQQVVDTHIQWLQGMLKTVESEDKNPQLRALYEEKEKLQEEKLSALDEQDTKKAQQKDVLLEAKEKEIQEMEAAIGKELQELQKKKSELEQEADQKQEEGQEVSGVTSRILELETQIGTLNAGLLEGSALSNIQEQKTDLLELLGEEELSQQQQAKLTEKIEGIGAMLEVSSSMAGNALKEIYEKMASAKYLNDTSQYDGWMGNIEEMMAEHIDALDGVLDAEEAVAVLEETLDCKLTSSGTGESGGGAEEDGAGESGNGENGSGENGSEENGTGSSGTGSGSGENGSGGSGSESGNEENGSGGSGTGSGNEENGSGGSGTGSGNGENGSGGSGTGSGNGENGSGGSGTGSGNGENGSGGSGTGSGNEENGSGNGGTGSGENGSSSTGTGSGENGSGSTGTGNGENGSGNGGTGSGENGSGSTGTGNGEDGSENGGTGNGENGSGNGGTGSGENGSGSTGTGNGENGSGNGGTGSGENGSSGLENGTGETGSGQSGTGESGTGTGRTQKSLGQAGSNTQNAKQAVAAAALAMYSQQTGSAGGNNVLSGLVQSSYEQENTYFFPVINKGSKTLYASAKAVSAYTGYRYIWNDNKKKAILASGADYYAFSAFQKKVDRSKDKQDTMNTEAAFQATVFLPEDYLKQEFGCQVYPLEDTGYAVLIDEEMLKNAAEALDVLIQESSR